nr:transposase family protein [Saccharothrix sp. ALI-22-I]
MHVADPVEGRTHDRHAFTTAGYDTLLVDTQSLGDLGTTAIRPRRKRPGHTSTPPQDKIHNRRVNQIRWAVEQAIAHLKNWKILATGYHARLTEPPTIIRIVTSLKHYRFGW